MPIYPHTGLYFTAEQITRARKDRDRAPLAAAWQMLLEQEQPAALAAIQWGGLRWRFSEDAAAGETAALRLAGLPLEDAGGSHLEQPDGLLAVAQCFELLRDHPAFEAAAQSEWLGWFRQWVDRFNQASAELTQDARWWLMALNTAAGVVLEDEALLHVGAAAYRQTVDAGIRPEGFLPGAVENSGGQSLLRQMIAVKALVLTAEIAQHTGLDLWGYHARGVSVQTACAYLIYYYHYPEKWRWDTVSADAAAALFRAHAGFWEMVGQRARIRGAHLILNDLRPIYDLTGGGLTTLTHGVAARRGLFG